LYKRIPKELLDRPKSGFGIPLGEWLRLPLRDWAEELLSRDRLILEGNFCPEYTHKIWSEHLSGEFDWSARLWNILMFQAWLENQ
jgi:asparagine synthase (glutamine-hydrolysing)